MEKKVFDPSDDPNKVIQKNVQTKYRKYRDDMDKISKYIRDENRKNDLDKSCNNII